MDAGAADAGIGAHIHEILAEPEDDQVVQPDIPDAVLPEMPVHKFGDGLADPAEGDLATLPYENRCPDRSGPDYVHPVTLLLRDLPKKFQQSRPGLIGNIHKHGDDT